MRSAAAASCCAVLAATLCVRTEVAGGASLPTAEASGVRVRADDGAVAVVFTRRAERLYRKIAGRVITIECTDLPARRNLGVTVVPSTSETFRAPTRRRTLRADSIAARHQDYCRLWLERKSRELIVSVPLTQPGAVHLDEEAKAGEMVDLLTIAGSLADRRGSRTWPTADELFRAEFGGKPLGELWPRPLAAIDSPSASPPPTAIGYYSDGRAHVASVILSAAGRRLFLELDDDRAVRTNVAEYIYASADQP
jgi:hypothetical protein